MNREELERVGRALAERHAVGAEPDPVRTVTNYAEMPRVGDWSMRSALMRLAQPEAVRAGRVLELVRRLDAALRHVARLLEKHTVVCDRRLAVPLADTPIEPYPDTRTADLARLDLDPDQLAVVIDAYDRASADPLTNEELVARPLLGVALELDRLAETLAQWANRGPDDPPVDTVDRTCAAVLARLDELGVPVEEEPPGGWGRRGRGERRS